MMKAEELKKETQEEMVEEMLRLKKRLWKKYPNFTNNPEFELLSQVHSLQLELQFQAGQLTEQDEIKRLEKELFKCNNTHEDYAKQGVLAERERCLKMKKELLLCIDKPKPMCPIETWNYSIAFCIKILEVLAMGKTMSELNQEDVEKMKEDKCLSEFEELTQKIKEGEGTK